MCKTTISLIVGTVLCAALGLAPDASADPDHLRCTTVTIRTRDEIPPGVSIRALQEGRNYPVWCR